MELEFSRQILKNSQILNFVKIRPVGFEFTWRVIFRNYC